MVILKKRIIVSLLLASIIFFMNKKIYLVALHQIWLTHKNLFDIFSKNQNYKDFYNKIGYESLKKYNIKDGKISKILTRKNNLILDDIDKKIYDNNVSIYDYYDIDYPNELKHIFNPPFLFYLKWTICNNNKIAFIWSRAISSYWKRIIEHFVPSVWKYFTVISWWASWCDSYSHRVSLENNINTISVLWTWIDINYPSYNKKLYDDIVDNWWAILSIFPFWEPWNSYNFPIRNEIVAWLSKWVFIVEAKKKSWTMITAKLALDMWKDVFCVPGDIFKSSSSWCNNLISKWEAKMVSCIDDILSEYDIKNDSIIKKIKIEDFYEKKIYEMLSFDNYDINQIKNKLGIDINTVCFKISMLEIYWYIKKQEDWKYIIN